MAFLFLDLMPLIKVKASGTSAEINFKVAALKYSFCSNKLGKAIEVGFLRKLT